jgi:hypothetical protein
MQKLIILFAVLMGFVFWKKQSEAEQRIAFAAARELASAEPICDGKEKCAVIYLAPWCPVCNRQLPAFKTLLTRANSNPKYTVKIFVGAGQTAADNNSKVQELGPGAVADNDGKIKSLLLVDKYPSYFVLDGKNTVVSKDFEAFTWINQTYSGAH